MLATGENDMLIGRGKPTTNHKGNITFKCSVQHCEGSHLCARSNYEEYLAVMEVKQKINNTSPSGRFSRQHAKTNLWIQIR